jgi:hypothetical protein
MPGVSLAFLETWPPPPSPHHAPRLGLDAQRVKALGAQFDAKRQTLAAPPTPRNEDWKRLDETVRRVCRETLPAMEVPAWWRGSTTATATPHAWPGWRVVAPAPAVHADRSKSSAAGGQGSERVERARRTRVVQHP